MWKPPRHKQRRDNRAIIPPPINGDASYSPHYKHWIEKECEDVSLLGLRLKHCQAVTLKSVYVPLITLKTGPTSISSGQFAKYTVVLDLLENNSLYISGAPGCGKSTFCRWVAWLACNKAIPLPDVKGKTAYTEVLPESLKKRLPLLVRLRGFWPFLPYTRDVTELTGVQLVTALEKWFKNLSPPGLTWAHLQTQIKKGCVIIIFDGIDEVPVSKEEGGGTIYPRALLLSGLISAIPSWRQKKNQVIVTSRPYDISDEDIKRLRLYNVTVEELDDDLKLLLVRRWFHILESSSAKADQTAHTMMEDICSREELQTLAANPMLLTAMCIIFGEGKRLPQDMYDLYERIMDNVLHSRYAHSQPLLSKVKARLSVIAYGMHTGEGMGENRVSPQAVITKNEIDRMLRSYILRWQVR